MSGPLGKCAPCLDKHLTGRFSDEVPVNLNLVPDAVVLTTMLQQFSVPGGQSIMAPCLVPVCLACRKAQLGTVSKKGLITA